MWFGEVAAEVPFKMYSIEHAIVVAILLGGIMALYLSRKKLRGGETRWLEWLLAITLILFEVSYQLWMVVTDKWDASHALPLQLSNFSIIFVIVLLFTRSKLVFEIVFLAGIGGALQAMITPVLSFGFPHFVFWHFFYTHMMVIWVAFYFLWCRGFSFTLTSVMRTMLFLNILLPLIYFINVLVGGNYWFIMRKPSGGSLLDFLGPHPWYILGMEFAALAFFLLLWLIFGQKNRRT
ncbi:TIGR02206 family membrane protein [Salipaludibacillus daqingensis]|uniref:YwaF family protein n=1 Tax=Salipaludibacillus daqingensis TaxID=3041001 RepID=UPI002476819A|nr:TIGR02206 family membrane protein [Salipaludibacillus daqingensis]